MNGKTLKCSTICGKAFSSAYLFVWHIVFRHHSIYPFTIVVNCKCLVPMQTDKQIHIYLLSAYKCYVGKLKYMRHVEWKNHATFALCATLCVCVCVCVISSKYFETCYYSNNVHVWRGIVYDFKCVLFAYI